jgi:hypothetical protein
MTPIRSISRKRPSCLTLEFKYLKAEQSQRELNVENYVSPEISRFNEREDSLILIVSNPNSVRIPETMSVITLDTLNHLLAELNRREKLRSSQGLISLFREWRVN